MFRAWWIRMFFRFPDAPALSVDVDRTMAQEVGLEPAKRGDQSAGLVESAAPDRAEFLGKSEQQRQLSAGRSEADVSRSIRCRICRTMPLATRSGKQGQLLMNVAQFSADKMPMVMSQLNIRPVFDVNADVQGRDMKSASEAIQKVIDSGSARRVSRR